MSTQPTTTPWWAYALGGTAIAAATTTVILVSRRPSHRRRRLTPVAAAAPTGAMRLGDGCTADEHTPCDYKVAIGVAYEVAAEANLPVQSRLGRIVDRGTVTSEEAEAVLVEWAQEVTRQPAPDPQHLYRADAVLQLTHLEGVVQ